MRVVIINTAERIGGAAIAASRLTEALRNSGIKAKMLVRDKQTDHVNVVALKKSWHKIWKFVWERLIIWKANHFKRENLFAVDIANTGTDVTSLPEFRQADVIHLHWVNQGMLSLKNIQKIVDSGKPIVWTMHDMWPITGICHHAENCTRYSEQCHTCPLLHKGHKNDLSYRVFNKKKEIYRNANLTFIACSRWLEGLARQSVLTQGHLVTNIPNPLNTNLFRPLDKIQSRQKFSLPTDKKLLLFSSMKTTDKRKGISYLVEACQILQKNYPEFVHQLAVVVVGKASQENESLFPFPVYCLDYVKQEKELAEIYNATDLFVTPSLMENLPNTIVEAMSCGIPCVGFNIGGIPQMIDHLHNGYVAQYKSAEDLANGIFWSLNENNYRSLCEQARRKAESTYSERIVAMKYIQIYNQITGKMHNPHHLHPKFSIITVTYNAGKVLEDTIQSVITQTYKNVEYILVDGGSTDNTLNIINQYRSMIQQVISEPDRGLYDAMNKGIRMATGDYICFLNAGDAFHEDDTLQQMVHSMTESTLPDVLYGETAIVDEEGHFIRMRRLSAPEHLTWKSFQHGMLVCHQAFFARRDLVEPYNLHYRFSADFDWCIRIMKKSKVLHNTHLTLIDYLNEGMTTRNHKASLKERFRIMCKHYGYLTTITHHIGFVARLLYKK